MCFNLIYVWTDAYMLYLSIILYLCKCGSLKDRQQDNILINFQNSIQLQYNDSSIEHIILVDLTIRSIADIEIYNEYWDSFKSKSLFANEDYSLDKFLFCHDIGNI